MDWAKTMARWDEQHSSFGIGCDLSWRFYGSTVIALWCVHFWNLLSIHIWNDQLSWGAYRTALIKEIRYPHGVDSQRIYVYINVRQKLSNWKFCTKDVNEATAVPILVDIICDIITSTLILVKLLILCSMIKFETSPAIYWNRHAALLHYTRNS